jgi:hypothetical protein
MCIGSDEFGRLADQSEVHAVVGGRACCKSNFNGCEEELISSKWVLIYLKLFNRNCLLLVKV